MLSLFTSINNSKKTPLSHRPWHFKPSPAGGSLWSFTVMNQQRKAASKFDTSPAWLCCVFRQINRLVFGVNRVLGWDLTLLANDLQKTDNHLITRVHQNTMNGSFICYRHYYSKQLDYTVDKRSLEQETVPVISWLCVGKHFLPFFLVDHSAKGVYECMYAGEGDTT